MNDRSVNILEKYEIEVLRTWRGRGAVLCETKTGIKILKEYKGSEKRLRCQSLFLEQLWEKGYRYAETILADKEGNLLVHDDDMTAYFLKEYRGGKECSSREPADCERAMRELAGFHRVCEEIELGEEDSPTPVYVVEEMEKHNRELKKVQRFLKEKSQKSEFEILLSKHYDGFYQKADSIRQQAKGNPVNTCLICHGDYQHHNILFGSDHPFLINFEKFVLDGAGRDIGLFFRKIMEKNNWDESIGGRLLGAYEQVRKLSPEEKRDLYYRLSYPEKFWKIVNFYYNSSKVWIPGKNMEKLEKLLSQEVKKNQYLEQSFLQWVLQ